MTPNAVADLELAAAVETLDACPLCSGRRFQPLPTPGRWIGADVFGGLHGRIGLSRCHSCDLVFTNPRPSAEWLGEFYAGDTYDCHETNASSAGGAKADFALAKIGKCLPPGVPRTLLDFGAGGGAFLLHARARGWTVHGFEPGRRGLETCQAVELDVTDDLEELPTRYFGLITLNHVFEHLADPVETLSRIHRLLAPDGRLFIEVPNVRSLRARLALPALTQRLAVDERHRAFPIHLMYYCDRTLRRMLAGVGWTVEKTFTLGLGLDELFLRPEASEVLTTGMGNHPAPAPPRRRWRHLLRDAFLALGLGENLAAIACAPPS
jgi:SAM-dependent methyltransferase